MKYLCLLAVLLTLPVTATAQQRRNDDRRTNDSGARDRNETERRQGDRNDRDRTPADRPSGRPAIFNPRAPSWEQKQSPWWERQRLPWWEGGATPSRQRNDRSDRNDRNDHDRRDGDQYRGRRNNAGGVIYVVPSYPYFGGITETATGETPPPPSASIKRDVPPPPPPAPAIGFLNLEVEPRALLQIYVDDVFLGTPADLGDELRLTPGTRRIELRAKGYKTLSFAAEIVENRSINYRGTLERDPAAPAAPAEPATRTSATSGPTTMYMIQGCYLGNVAPRPSDLRAGCDIARMITFKP